MTRPSPPTVSRPMVVVTAKFFAVTDREPETILREAGAEVVYRRRPTPWTEEDCGEFSPAPHPASWGPTP